MAIPQSFRKKYSLEGEVYDKQDVEAALSALYAMSTRLYSENTDLRRELDELKEKTENEASVAERLDALADLLETISSDNEEIKARLDDIELKLDGISVDAAAAAGEDDGADVLAEMKEIDMSSVYDNEDNENNADNEDNADNADVTAGEEADASDDNDMEIELYEIPADAEPDTTGEADADAEFTEDTADETADENVDENVDETGSTVVIGSEKNDGPDDSDIAAQLRLAVIGADKVAAENADTVDVALDDVVSDGGTATENADETDTSDGVQNNTEDVPAGSVTDPDEPSREQIITAAGLDTDPVDEEPAAPVAEDSITRMLAALYSKPAGDAENNASEDDPAAVAEDERDGKDGTDGTDEKKDGKTSVSDMRSSLDAIRRRLGKK